MMSSTSSDDAMGAISISREKRGARGLWGGLESAQRISTHTRTYRAFLPGKKIVRYYVCMDESQNSFFFHHDVVSFYSYHFLGTVATRGVLLLFFQTRAQASKHSGHKDKQRLSPPGRSRVKRLIFYIFATNGRIGSPLDLELIVARMRRKPCFLWLLVFVAAICWLAREFEKKKPKGVAAMAPPLRLQTVTPMLPLLLPLLMQILGVAV